MVNGYGNVDQGQDQLKICCFCGLLRFAKFHFGSGFCLRGKRQS